MLLLAIKKSTWHYKYYTILKKLWAMDMDKECKSVCPYVHMLFWLSILTVLLFPFSVIGWLSLKGLRYLYKVFNFSAKGAKVIDFLDDKINFGKKIEKASRNIKDYPIPVSVVIGFLSLLTVFAGLLIMGCCIMGIGWILFNLAQVPGLVWYVILGVFYIIFYFCATLGLFLHFTIWLLSIIGKAIGSFFLSYGLSILTVIGWTVGILVLLMFFVYIAIRITFSKRSETFREWLSFKFNGFQAARQIAVARIEQKKNENKEAGKLGITSKIWNFIKTFFSSEEKTKYGTVKTLGVFAIIWLFLKGIKNGICPLVEFTDEEQEVAEDVVDA